MDSILGDGTSPVVKFFIAFVVVFALIAVTAWLIRRFGTGALGGTGARGRAPRLAVIEAGAVDGRRKLVLIRRDNIEHLIMIGGPTDIVVEANIVRGQNARDTASSRASSAAEQLPRTLPAEETAWPLQPEAAPRPARAARPAPLEDTHWALAPETAAPVPVPPAAPKRSRSAETLAGLAAELSVRPSEPAVSAPVPRPAQPKPAAPAPASSAAADQNLADMASRLEAALRRPASPPVPAPRPAAPKPAADSPRAAPPVAPPVAPPPPAPPVAVAPPVVPPVAPPAPPVAQEPASTPAVASAPVVTIEPEKPADEKPARTESKADDVFGSIEEEMANLLGRPSGKAS